MDGNKKGLHIIRMLSFSLLLASPLVVGIILSPDVFIDDAYITFRYAENISAGLGFTYNPGEKILGTTTPLYCLWLSFWNMLGISTFSIAIITGTLSLSFCALLLWRIGKIKGLALEGLASAIILLLFPRFWEHMLSGMETTLAAALCILVIWLDLRKSAVWCGLASACLILTRPDAAMLVAAVIIVRFFYDRKDAVISAAVTLAGLMPWAVFGMIYFGSPLPSSLAVKRLIHPFPWHMVLKKYLAWFIMEPALIGLSLLWLIGAFFIIRHRRDLLALVLWPIFFITAMAATQIGPFYWYKMPLLSGYFLVAATGAWFIFSSLIPETKQKWRERGFVILIAVLILSSIASVPYLYLKGQRINILQGGKEKIYLKISEEIKERGSQGDKVFVGDVGVLGYYLRDFFIIDSSGLNSPEVYRIRLEDRKNILEKNPQYRYDWWGSPEWSRRIIKEMKPDFITTDINYLHIRKLMKEPWFQEEYQLVQDWTLRSDSGTSMYLLFQKRIVRP